MGRLVTIAEEECYRLLAGEVVGRIAFDTVEGPAVVPVNYALVDGTLHVRTVPDGYVARGRTVAFEVDSVDLARWTGWSVLVNGPARLRPAPPARTLPRARSWAGEEGRHLLVITCESVTGRRLCSGPE